MNKAKVSIIIPVYNSEKYIGNCLNSILNQSFIDFEVICINDGSSDDSLNILKEYESKDKRIKVIEQKNGGPSKARNVGINNINGEYIAFIDSDDYIKESYLKDMLKDAYNDDIVICNYIEENDTGRHKVDIFKFLLEGQSENNNDIVTEVISGSGGLVWGKLFRSALINKELIRFNEGFKMCEDLLFTTEVIIHAKSIKKVNKSLYVHNKCNENSITANYDIEMFFKQIELQDKIKEIIVAKYNKGYLQNILLKRLKDIVIYSIYKEVDNNKPYKEKLNNIKRIIELEEIKVESTNFVVKGPIDKLLIKSLIRSDVKSLYILTKFRSCVLKIYYSIYKLRRE